MFKNLMGRNVPIINWKFVKDKREENDIKHTYEIPEKYKIIATDDIGDIIAIRNRKVIIINHEEGKEKILERSNEYFWSFIEELMSIPNYSENESLESLNEIKDVLKKLKERAPKGIKYLLKRSYNDLKEKINDLKFNQSPSGKLINEIQTIRFELDRLLKRPKKYKGVDLEKKFDENIVYVYGSCMSEDENVDEIKSAVKSIKSELEIRIKYLKTYEEYKNLFEDNK